MQFAAVEAEDDYGGAELQGAEGGAEVDSCEAGFVPVLLQGGAFGVEGFGSFGRHDAWSFGVEMVLVRLLMCEDQGGLLWWFAWCR